MMIKVFFLENTVQNYAWGSKTAIPHLLKIDNPDGREYAELWMGSHPKAPSRAVTPSGLLPLDVLIAGDPDFFLGRRVADAFGPVLPFLFKVLAAEKPLSLQAHPNLTQARAGYSREEALHIPIDAPERNYRDTNHKPEILCAVSPFHALYGFRGVDEIKENLKPLSGMTPLLGELEGHASCRDFFSGLLSMPENMKKRLIAEALEYVDGRDDPASFWVRHLSAEFPGDVGALSPFFLNILTLEPGQAIFLSAGVLHAYLRGTGIELMANSDNVLRGGCTVKHIDPDELLRVLDFSPLSPEPMEAFAPGTAMRRYKVPVGEFLLTAILLEDERQLSLRDRTGPEILLCTEGSGTLKIDKETYAFSRGRSLFIAAAAGSYSLEGSGRLFRASVPES